MLCNVWCDVLWCYVNAMQDSPLSCLTATAMSSFFPRIPWAYASQTFPKAPLPSTWGKYKESTIVDLFNFCSLVVRLVVFELQERILPCWIVILSMETQKHLERHEKRTEDSVPSLRICFLRTQWPWKTLALNSCNLFQSTLHWLLGITERKATLTHFGCQFIPIYFALITGNNREKGDSYPFWLSSLYWLIVRFWVAYTMLKLCSLAACLSLKYLRKKTPAPVTNTISNAIPISVSWIHFLLPSIQTLLWSCYQ